MAMESVPPGSMFDGKKLEGLDLSGMEMNWFDDGWEGERSGLLWLGRVLFQISNFG